MHAHTHAHTHARARARDLGLQALDELVDDAPPLTEVNVAGKLERQAILTPVPTFVRACTLTFHCRPPMLSGAKRKEGGWGGRGGMERECRCEKERHTGTLVCTQSLLTTLQLACASLPTLESTCIFQ